MKITSMLAIALGLSALAACGGGGEENATDNMDANLEMPVDNFDTMDANAANELDANLANDANAANDTANTGATDTTATGNTGY